LGLFGTCAANTGTPDLAPQGATSPLLPMLRIVLWVVRFMLSAFAVWVVLTTVVPQTVVKYTDPLVATQRFAGQTAYPHWLLPGVLRIQNSTVWFVIAHPDDEVMFFAPSVVELAKPKNGNDVKLLCFLRGAAVDASMGEIRARELHVLARILGVGEVVVLDYEDGMKVEWDADAVAGGGGGRPTSRPGWWW
jgi:N-acetylglucosaminylphosphatidylinositol deacetylase